MDPRHQCKRRQMSGEDTLRTPGNPSSVFEISTSHFPYADNTTAAYQRRHKSLAPIKRPLCWQGNAVIPRWPDYDSPEQAAPDSVAGHPDKRCHLHGHHRDLRHQHAVLRQDERRRRVREDRQRQAQQYDDREYCFHFVSSSS